MLFFFATQLIVILVASSCIQHLDQGEQVNFQTESTNKKEKHPQCLDARETTKTRLSMVKLDGPGVKGLTYPF